MRNVSKKAQQPAVIAWQRYLNRLRESGGEALSFAQDASPEPRFEELFASLHLMTEKEIARSFGEDGVSFLEAARKEAVGQIQRCQQRLGSGPRKGREAAKQELNEAYSRAGKLKAAVKLARIDNYNDDCGARRLIMEIREKLSILEHLIQERGGFKEFQGCQMTQQPLFDLGSRGKAPAGRPVRRRKPVKALCPHCGLVHFIEGACSVPLSGGKPMEEVSLEEVQRMMEGKR